MERVFEKYGYMKQYGHIKEIFKNRCDINLYKTLTGFRPANNYLYITFLNAFLNKNNTTFDDIIIECENFIKDMRCDDIAELFTFINKLDCFMRPHTHIIKMVILYVLKRLGYNGILSYLYTVEAYKNLLRRSKVNIKVNALKENAECYMKFTRLSFRTLNLIYNFVGEYDLCEPFFSDHEHAEIIINESLFKLGVKFGKEFLLLHQQ